MKIVLFHIAPIEWPGGCEKYFASLAMSLSEQGHHVVVAGSSYVYYLFMCAFYSMFGAITGKGLHIMRPVPHPKRDVGGATVRQVRLAELLPFTRTRRRFVRMLRQADVIYCKNEWMDLVALRLFLPRALLRKVVLGMHSAIFIDEQAARTPWGRIHNLLYEGRFYRRQLHACGAIHVLNAAYARLLADHFDLPAHKTMHLPNWLDQAEIDRLAPRADDVLARPCLRVLFAQRLTQQKGLDYLAALVIALSTKPQFEHVRFTIAGSNGDYEELARELAERFANVTYRGFVSDMVGLYAEHDVAIVPSRWEMFPYSVLEPQAAGLPVIAFDIPGPQDIIVDGITGWLVPPGNIDRLQEVVQEIIDRHRHHPDTLQTMRRCSRDLAIARFNRERVLHQVVGLLAAVAGYPCGGAPS